MPSTEKPTPSRNSRRLGQECGGEEIRLRDRTRLGRGRKEEGRRKEGGRRRKEEGRGKGEGRWKEERGGVGCLTSKHGSPLEDDGREWGWVHQSFVFGYDNMTVQNNRLRTGMMNGARQWCRSVFGRSRYPTLSMGSWTRTSTSSFSFTFFGFENRETGVFS